MKKFRKDTQAASSATDSTARLVKYVALLESTVDDLEKSLAAAQKAALALISPEVGSLLEATLNFYRDRAHYKSGAVVGDGGKKAHVVYRLMDKLLSQLRVEHQNNLSNLSKAGKGEVLNE